MLFHNVFCVCFLALLAQKNESNAELNSETEKPETLFADVIKNISRVNNELQDLINNYEQFKKAQNSLEIFDDNESDADGGRVNRNSKHSVGSKRDRSNKTSTTVQYHTKMIYDEEEEETSSEPEKSIETEISKSGHNNKVDKSHEVKSRKPMAKTDKYKLKVHKTTTQASIANEEPITSREETEPENKKIKIKTDRRKRITPKAAVEQAPKKTIYFEKEKQTKYLKHNSSGSDSSVDFERYTEDKEVHLNKPKERAYEKSTDGPYGTVGIYLRSQTNDSMLTKGLLTTTKVDNVVSVELTDDDEALFKDLFKTSVLRQAYGDACLKLVIRKCYRACKSAYKSSCQAISCKSELKRYFEKSSKTGCIDVFNGSSKGDVSDSLRRIVSPTTLNSGMMTREGYLSVACQTPIEKRTRRIPLSNTTKTQHGEQLNILRDKYEKACQKISQDKCGKACYYAQNATCVKYKCKKRLKKNFKKYCRIDCKLAYSSKTQKSSSSGSDDDSDSGSGDESDQSDDSDGDDDDDDDDDDDKDDDDES